MLATRLARALVAHAIERLELFLGRARRGRAATHEAGVDELVDDLLAQALDVERAPAGEMQDRELALRGAEEAALAAVVDAALLARDRAAAHRARRAACGSSARSAAALGGHAADDFGDDVAGAPHDHGVADAHVLARAPRTGCAASRCETVVPPTNTGSSLATGVSLPVRPTWTSMSRSSVVCSCAGYFCATAQRGSRDLKPSLLLQRARRRPCRRRRRSRTAARRALRRDALRGSRPARPRPATRACIGLAGKPIASKRVEQRRSASPAPPSPAPRRGRRRRS